MDVLKNEVYKKRSHPFANLDQLKRRIRRGWQCAINIDHIEEAILQFRFRLQQVRRPDGGAIEEHFGNIVKLLHKQDKFTMDPR